LYSLEGLNGYIYITTKEELDEILSLSYKEIIEKNASENKNFDMKEYL
jgi:exosome complex RNA-binding protein Rrp4